MQLTRVITIAVSLNSGMVRTMMMRAPSFAICRPPILLHFLPLVVVRSYRSSHHPPRRGLCFRVPSGCRSLLPAAATTTAAS